jgi:hypothetical protein
MSTTAPLEIEADASPGVAASSTATNFPHALSSVQERRLMDYLDEKILENQREYKKRQALGLSYHREPVSHWYLSSAIMKPPLFVHSRLI